MQKRIYFNFLGLLLISIIILAISFSQIFLNAARNQEIAAIRDKTYLIANILNNGIFENDLSHTEGSRITIIAPDGLVLIDSHAHAEILENRGDRAEFIQAMLNGSGEATRYSTVFNSETYYYALRLQDGYVLRISRTLNSLGEVFTAILPVLIAVTVVVLLLAHFIARRLTHKIVKPLLEIDLDNTNNIYDEDFYAELSPYIKKINRQKQELEQQISEQHKAETQRREFSANVSHELKTPLTTIAALSEMMASGMAKIEDFSDFASRISSQTKRLINIIDDIIRLSEFDENKTEREYTNFDIYELAKSVICNLNGKATEKNVTIDLIGKSLQMTANLRLIDELLYNLIDNAIKYNQEDGKVTVDFYTEHDGCKISVSDTGIGIPQKHQDRIFERFYRADKSRSKKTGGTGLGLSIVKHIVGHHHGEIELESTEGVGTTIKCFFPL